MRDVAKEKEEQMKDLITRWKKLKQHDPAAGLAELTKSIKETEVLKRGLKNEKD